jgi:hypothetical protein
VSISRRSSCGLSRRSGNGALRLRQWALESAALDLALRVGFANPGGLVFVDESAEDVVTLWLIGPVERRRIRSSTIGWNEIECAVRPVLVVVATVDLEDVVGQLLRPLILPELIDQLVRDLHVAHHGPPSGQPGGIAPLAVVTTPSDAPVGYREIRALPGTGRGRSSQSGKSWLP